MSRVIRAGLALILCIGPAAAQNTLNAPTAAPTGGPESKPLAEPANTRIEDGGVPGAETLTENEARTRLERGGYSAVSGLVKGDDGAWRGVATKDGVAGPVRVDAKHGIAHPSAAATQRSPAAK